jgi:hypothetical protein
LATLPFRQQLQALEFYMLLVDFCLNVLVLQFYLGTARVQLEELGDDDHTYVRVLNFIVPGVSLLELLDREGLSP